KPLTIGTKTFLISLAFHWYHPCDIPIIGWPKTPSFPFGSFFSDISSAPPCTIVACRLVAIRLTVCSPSPGRSNTTGHMPHNNRAMVGQPSLPSCTCSLVLCLPLILFISRFNQILFCFFSFLFPPNFCPL